MNNAKRKLWLILVGPIGERKHFYRAYRDKGAAKREAGRRRRQLAAYGCGPDEVTLVTAHGYRPNFIW